jgi:DNA invertase Pin-like site-specific DNA recombinase
MPTAYSYARFSSERQKHGQSLSRQTRRAVAYANANSLILDTSTYKDLGVSAFRSKNYIEGSLGAFIEAVDSGRVSKGSYLLVESLDRLSRDTIDIALELFLSIIRRGITIVTLIEPPEVFSQAIIRDNPSKLLVAIVTLWRANEESKTKRDRALRKIEDRALKGQLPTTRLPTWLKFSADYKSATLITDRARVVRRIFDETISGIGTREIARRLNKDGTPVLFYATEWRQSAISQLLKNPATYGEFKGKVILPAAIPKARFMKAQQVVRDRTLFKGGFSRSNPNNSLVGLARCGHCGRPMRYLPRTEGPVYMRCVGSQDNGVCDRGRLFPFESCETALVVHLTVMETNFGLTRAIFTEKHEQAQSLDQEIEMVKAKQERLVKLADVAGDIEALGTQLKGLQTDLTRLLAERKTIGDSDTDHAESTALFSDYSALVHRRTDYKPISGAGDITELRRKLKMAFVRVLKRVEFLNADVKKWQPTLRLTYSNDRTALVDVTPWLPERTQVKLTHGIYHRADLGKRKIKKRR